MNKKTIAEVSNETLRIEEFLKTLHNGQQVSYSEIEKQSGVKMNARGRGFMRTALKRLNLEFTTIHGEGIELGSPDNAMRIISTRIVRIDNSVRRAEKTVKNVHDKFYDSLNDIEKKNVMYLGAVFGAIRQHSNSAKAFFKKEHPKVINP